MSFINGPVKQNQRRKIQKTLNILVKKNRIKNIVRNTNMFNAQANPDDIAWHFAQPCAGVVSLHWRVMSSITEFGT